MSSSSKLIDILGLSKFRNRMNEDINGKINTRAEASHTHVSDDIASLDASKLTGVIDIARLPAAALERLTIVDNTEARLALTINDVQNGDTVQEDDTGLLYRVIDDSKLGTEEAFRAYTSGASSTVPWSGVLNKPDKFPPAEHIHTTVNGHTVESNVPADAVFTNTTYGMSSAMGGVKLESSNGDIDEVQVGIFYASCDTSCNTPDKVVTCGNFKLQTGAVIAVSLLQLIHTLMVRVTLHLMWMVLEQKVLSLKKTVESSMQVSIHGSVVEKQLCLYTTVYTSYT